MFSCKYHTTPHLSSKNNTLICDKRHCYTQKQSRQNISMLYLLTYYFPSKTSWKVILDISSAKTFCTLYSLCWTLHMPLFLHDSGFSIHLFIAILPSIVSITSLRVISDGFLFKTYPPFTPLYDLIIPAWTIQKCSKAANNLEKISSLHLRILLCGNFSLRNLKIRLSVYCW